MLIALDIGTTNVKAVAFGEDGRVLARADRSNQMVVGRVGESEQEPDKVFQNVMEVLEDVLEQTSSNGARERLRGIVFSAAMHGLVAVDEAGQPLTNFMLWSDVRAHAEAMDLLRPGAVGSEIYRRTGVPIHPMSPLIKLIWLRNNRADVFKSAHKFLGIKEFVWHRFTGKFESDLSCASASGLMNLWSNEWDTLALDVAGVSREQLPALVPPTHLSSANILLQGQYVPLMIGASDGALANLGAGVTQPGEACVTIGTSAAIRVMTDAPQLDPQMRTFCYRLDDGHCIVGGASNNGTNALEWLRTSVFQSALSPEDFANQAMLVPPGAEGLCFLPYLQGERAPVWDAMARASFTGLTAQHTQAHFVRAVMEGVLSNLKSILEVLEMQYPIHIIHANGGFAHNKLWVNMLAEIFQKEVKVASSQTDASVQGAFLLARYVFAAS